MIMVMSGSVEMRIVGADQRVFLYPTWPGLRSQGDGTYGPDFDAEGRPISNVENATTDGGQKPLVEKPGDNYEKREGGISWLKAEEGNGSQEEQAASDDVVADGLKFPWAQERAKIRDGAPGVRSSPDYDIDLFSPDFAEHPLLSWDVGAPSSCLGVPLLYSFAI
jgi:hypothetical protein